MKAPKNHSEARKKNLWNPSEVPLYYPSEVLLKHWSIKQKIRSTSLKLAKPSRMIKPSWNVLELLSRKPSRTKLKPSGPVYEIRRLLGGPRSTVRTNFERAYERAWHNNIRREDQEWVHDGTTPHEHLLGTSGTLWNVLKCFWSPLESLKISIKPTGTTPKLSVKL